MRLLKVTTKACLHGALLLLCVGEIHPCSFSHPRIYDTPFSCVKEDCALHSKAAHSSMPLYKLHASITRFPSSSLRQCRWVSKPNFMAVVKHAEDSSLFRSVRRLPDSTQPCVPNRSAHVG